MVSQHRSGNITKGTREVHEIGEKGRSSKGDEMKDYIYAYILAKTLNEQGEDPIRCCQPFVLRSFPPGAKFVTQKELQGHVKNDSGLTIPLHTLGSILRDGESQGYVENSKNNYRLTRKGLHYLDNMEGRQDVRRRLNRLYNDVNKFFATKGSRISNDEVSEMLFCFTKRNIESLLQLFFSATLTEGSDPFPVTSKLSGREKLLVQYIQKAKGGESPNYEILREIALGSLLIIAGCLDSFFRHKNKFKNCYVYLDSNVIFNVLGMHSPEFSVPSQEVFSMLKRYGFRVKVFDFTIDEVTTVVAKYPREAKRYLKGLKVDSIYSSLKEQNWTEGDTREFITNVDSILEDKGIEIERTGVRIQDYEPKHEQYAELITRYKPKQPESARLHDVAAIEHVMAIRKHARRKLEDARAFFLTADGYLCQCNFVEMGHKERGTVSEVILERLLTNVLWLMNPNYDISLESLIAVCSRDLFVKQRVWEQFYNVLSDVKMKGLIATRDLSMLFWHNYIEMELSEFDEADVGAIDEGFVAEEVQKAAKFFDDEKKRELSEKIEEIENCMEYHLQSLRDEHLRKWAEKSTSVKHRALARSRKKADSIAKVSSVALTVVVIVALVIGYFILRQRGLTGALTFLVTFVTGSGGALSIMKFLRTYLAKEVYAYLARHKLRELRDVGFDVQQVPLSEVVMAESEGACPS